MKNIIIPSYGRADTIRTHKYLEASGIFNYKIALHTEDCRKEYLKNATIRPETLFVSGLPKGITRQRNWAMDNLVPKNEWFIFMDDNIRTIESVGDEWYYESKIADKDNPVWRERFKVDCPADKFFKKCEGQIKMAEKLNVHHSGFATVDNYFFRIKKWRFVGYVISKVVLIKNSGLRYDENCKGMGDYGFTAENLLRHGQVLINNFIYPISGHYESGGIGTYEQRLPWKIQDCKYLMEKYPGLFRQPNKSTADQQGELQVRFTNPEQVAVWRGKLLAQEAAKKPDQELPRSG